MQFNFRANLVALAASILLQATSARADYTHTYVSNSGADANTCGAPVKSPNNSNGPCRSFSSALGAAVDGGTLICVDAPNFYENLYITKSVTIDCLAGGGTIGGLGITIDAPGKNVRIRNFGANIVGYLSNVIDIVAAGSVQLENVSLAGSSNFSIRDRRTGPGKLSIINSVFTGNSGPAIVIVPQGGSSISAVLDNVTAQNSNYGLAAGIGARVMVSRSTFSGNFAAGIEGDPGAIIAISDSRVQGNPTGILASAGANIVVSNTQINSNNVAVQGTVRSTGNNNVLFNISDGTPLTPVAATSNENGLR